MRRFTTLLLLCVTGSAFAGGPQVTEEPFGKVPDSKDADGKVIPGGAVTKYTLTNRNGAKASIMTYGAILTNMWVPDKDGKLADVVMGFDTIEGYLGGHPYFGSNVGRCGNRIAKGKFTLEGKEYTLATNNGPNHLHGGVKGFDKKIWRGEAMMTAAGPSVKLTYTSPNGEEGYPGTLSVVVQYTLTVDNALRVETSATTDKTTVCNICHHSYFNLAGHNSGTILDHDVQILAKNYTPTDDTLIPTGKIEPVAGTPFDFTSPTAIGKRIKEIKADPVGYDLNFALDAKAGGMPNLAVIVSEPKSGRTLEVYTDQPGMQFYTGNFLKDEVGKGGSAYKQYGAFCFEAQKYPDSINKPEWCKGVLSPILKPGEEYKQFTVYKFGVK
ncbi:MAG: aldose epimerase family protein [Gemmataceae bacterium]